MTPDAAELHRRARKLLPPEVYDYYAGGSGRERTLRANEKAWRRVWLAPGGRHLLDRVACRTRARGYREPMVTSRPVAHTVEA